MKTNGKPLLFLSIIADQFPLPTQWTRMKSAEFYTLDELHTASSEYQIVENLFKASDDCEIIQASSLEESYLRFWWHIVSLVIATI